MTEIAKHEPGSFSWAELATSDPAAAKKFYTSLFGWSIKDNPMGPGPDDVYTLLQIGGKDVAALYKMMKEQAQQGVPPNWMCYVTVENADETAKKAKSLGGTVITETVFAWPGLGRLAVEAIMGRDYPVVQTVVLLISAMFVTINLVVDLLYRFIDPRVDLA